MQKPFYVYLCKYYFFSNNTVNFFGIVWFGAVKRENYVVLVCDMAKA